jgi:hypothetical protein
MSSPSTKKPQRFCEWCGSPLDASRRDQRFCRGPAICRQRWNNRHGMTPGRIKGAVVKLLRDDADVRAEVRRVK